VSCSHLDGGHIVRAQKRFFAEIDGPMSCRIDQHDFFGTAASEPSA